ncbi:MAG: hypothetical protein ACI8RD_013558, partial [Bacillariaceae sp.]
LFLDPHYCTEAKAARLIVKSRFAIIQMIQFPVKFLYNK